MKKLIKTKTHLIVKHIKYRIISTLLFCEIICLQSFSQLILDDVTKPIYDDIYSTRAIEISVPVETNKYGEDIEVASQVSITLKTGFSASKDNGSFHAYKSTATNWVSYDGCPTTPTNVPLTAGNVYIITNGTYSGCKYIFTGTGSSSSPINIRPESPGGVEFTKNGSEPTLIEVTGSSIIMEGFKWDANDYDDSTYTVMVNFDGASNCTFRNNSVVSSGKTIENSPLIRVRDNSDDLTIERNYFEDNQNIGIQVFLEEGEDPSENTQIRENFFYNNSLAELIAIGQGLDDNDNWLFDQSTETIIESNLFENNNMPSTNPEMILSKSTNNTIRYNTIRDCIGTISLRWGKNCLVDGNWFFNSQGIRIFDEGHIILNNYFYGEPFPSTNNISEVIACYRGEIDRDLDHNGDGFVNTADDDYIAQFDPYGFSSGHFPAKDIKIYNNTIYNSVISSGSGIYVGRTGFSFLGIVYHEPDEIEVFNNLIKNDLGYSILYPFGTNVDFIDNIVHLTGTGQKGYNDGSDVALSDPFLSTADDNGIYRLDITKYEVIDQGDNSVLTIVTSDFDGQARPFNSIIDIGCDEYSLASVIHEPLIVGEIGATYNKRSDMIESKPIENIVITDITNISIWFYKNRLNIDIVSEGNYMVDVYNLLGQKVQCYKLDNMSKGTSKIENVYLENGIYIVNLVKGNTVVKSQKIAAF